MSDEELKKIVLEIMSEHNTMSIATMNNLGMPECAAVFYVNIDLRLCFLSNPTSRHAKNICSGTKCAVTIQKDHHDWQQIKGLQLEGWVEPINSPADKLMFLKKYNTKYSYLENLLNQNSKILKAFSKAKIYKFNPEIIWVTDNSYGFGQRRELIVPHSV